MLALVRLMRSKKQVLELACLLLSLPLVFINLDLHLARLSPRTSSLVAAVNTRRVRELSLSDLEEAAESNSTELGQTPPNNQFETAFRQIFSSEMEERREVVRAVCEEHQAELQWSQEDLEWHMRHKNLWDIQHRVVFCPIAKVASTSWFMNFLEMAGVHHDEIDIVMEEVSDEMAKNKNTTVLNWEGEAGGRGIRALTRYIYQPPAVDNLTALNNVYTKMTGFFMIRHPFVRLVSAYEDKMLNPHPFPFGYHHKIQEIIKSKRKNKDKKINFPKDLLNSVRYRQMLRNKLVTLAQLSKQPSFSEFVSWLIADRWGKDGSYKSWARDNTWVPYHAVCPVCQSRYHILKLDTDKDEMKSFIDHQHLPIKKTAKIHTKGGKRNSVAKADRYFSSLSEDQVSQLYQIYKYDFQMFGYEYESYLQLASLNTNKKKNEFDLALEKVREEEKHQTKKKKQKQGKQKKTNNRRGQAGGMKKKPPFKLHK